MQEGDLVDRRYLLRERLGAGMFGSVHRAQHRVADVTLRDVAIKLFEPSRTERASKVGAILNEALTLVSVVERCPDPTVRDHFVMCHDAGLASGISGQWYLVMELVDQDLARRISHGPLPVRTAISFAKQICKGLAFMHERHYLHRDLKPGNVLLTTAGHIKIGDFGLAAPINELLRKAPAAGTMTHQPPEALALKDCGPSADVYAVGLICYQMLTGRLPWEDELLSAVDGDDVRSLVSIKLRPAPSPSEVNLELREYPRFEEWVLCALDPVASARYSDGAALLRALEEAAQGREVDSPARPLPRQMVEDALHQAQGALRRGDAAGACELATQAQVTNQGLPPSARVPDVFPVLVEALLAGGRTEEAEQTAVEGIRWLPCVQTKQAMARAFQGTKLGRFYAEEVRGDASGG